MASEGTRFERVATSSSASTRSPSSRKSLLVAARRTPPDRQPDLNVVDEATTQVGVS